MEINFLITYYKEIRNRVSLAFFGVLSFALVSFFYKEILLCLITTAPNTKVYFIFTDVTEIVSTYIKLIFFLASQVFLLLNFYHALVFLSPGLIREEWKNLISLFRTSLFAWGLSLWILNKLLISSMWNFFLSFKNELNLNNLSLFFEAKLTEYLKFYIDSYYLCLLNCQFVVFLGNVVSNMSGHFEEVQNFRKFFYCFFVLTSTFSTPPDVFSQLLVSFCLIFVYEILVFFQVLWKTN